MKLIIIKVEIYQLFKKKKQVILLLKVKKK